MFEAPVQRLIDELARLPGIGTRSAQRIAFHLLNVEEADAERMPFKGAEDMSTCG